MKAVFISKHLEVAKEVNQTDTEIHLFTQFFIHKQAHRNEELRYCLNSNLLNPHLTKVHLLNERPYSTQELGIEKIQFQVQNRLVQHDTKGKRLTIQMVLQYIREKSLKGYFIITNADIFLDRTIRYLKPSTLHEKKQALALLRYEYKGGNDLSKCTLFGPRFDSQDTWILHSNQMVKEDQERIFNFEFGKAGIDNKMIYLMRVLGYEVINDPLNIKTYHFHRSIQRDYHGKEPIGQPWGLISPAGVNPLAIPPSLGVNFADVFKVTAGFQTCMFDDNAFLFSYITKKLQDKEAFIIPRIAGIENNMAVFTKIKKDTGEKQFDPYFQQTLPVMKRNAGIMLTSPESLLAYSELYLKAFQNCEIFGAWEIQGEVFKHIAQSHEYIRGQVAPNKRNIWAFVFDIFHYIYDPQCWTKSLEGKRLLIISPFVESIREKINIRTKIYDGVDIFPNCTFVFAKPPQTQGNQQSQDFQVELNRFKGELDQLKDQYDVALVSCGGYGNLVCNYIFESHRKSAIYVGGVLQMYFGVLGGRWLKERPDVLRLFMNEHWSRPKESEKPNGCGQIENGCYW